MENHHTPSTSAENPTVINVAPPEQATASTNMQEASTAPAAADYCVVDYLYPDETNNNSSNTHSPGKQQHSSKHPRRNSLSKIVKRVMMGRRSSTGGSTSNSSLNTGTISNNHSQNGSEGSHDKNHNDHANLYHDTTSATTAAEPPKPSPTATPTTKKLRTSKLHRFGRKHKDNKKLGRSKSMTDAIPNSKSKKMANYRRRITKSNSMHEPTIYYTRTASGRGSLLMGMDHLLGHAEANTNTYEATAPAMELDDSIQSRNPTGSHELSSNNTEKSSPQKEDTNIPNNHNDEPTASEPPSPHEQPQTTQPFQPVPHQPDTELPSLVLSPSKSTSRRRTIMDPSNMHKTFVRAPVQGMTSLVQKAGSTVATGGNMIVKGTTSTVQKGGKAVIDGGKFFVEGTTNTVVYGGKAVMDGGKHVVEGTTHTVVMGGKTIVGGGKAIVEGTTTVVGMGGKAVMDGGKLLVEGTTCTVQKGGKAVMDGGKLIVEGTANTVVLGGKTIVGGGKAIVEGTTTVVGMGGKAVMDGGKLLVEGTTCTVQKGGRAVMDGGKLIVEGTANTVVLGGKTIVGGGKAIVEGTTTVVGYGGKTVVKGAKGVVKGLKKASNIRSFHFHKKQMSKWEEGLEVIDELLLDSECAAYHALTPEQRKKLQSVKKILLKGPTGDNKTHHVPRELLHSAAADLEYERMDITDFMGLRSGVGGMERRKSSIRGSIASNSTFILQEYAGVKNTSSFLNDMSDTDFMCGRRRADTDNDKNNIDTDPCVEASTTKTASDSVIPTNVSDVKSPPFENVTTAAAAAAIAAADKEIATGTSAFFCPPEWLAFSTEDKLQVMKMLSWESISQWNYDIFRLAELTKGHTLLFMGYAILGAPYSQQAMAAELGLPYDSHKAPQEGYNFGNELTIPPEKLCNYIRTIESDYSAENPYHNSTHAADVLQSLHTLIQASKDVNFMKGCPPLYLLTILLAAIVHDVAHPGKTNAFQIQVKSELAVMYNDRSVLENWHVAHAFSRMLNVDLGGLSSEQVKHQVLNGTMYDHHNKDSPNNILCHASQDQFNMIRKHMIEAVLHTDMTSHFESVNSARGMLLEDEEESGGLKKKERTWRLLMYMLHLADISGQAKGGNLFIEWTHRCMDEFFKQGDEELKLGLPVSPNCDRNTLVPSVAQMGFIEFVVEPAYQVLGNYIPFVQEIVLPIIQKNLEYWIDQDEDADDGPLIPALESIIEPTSSALSESQNLSQEC